MTKSVKPEDNNSELAVFPAKVLQTSTQPFCACYPDGRLMVWNDAFRELTGYTDQELKNTRWMEELTSPMWRNSEAEILKELRSSGKPQHYEKEFLRKDGSQVSVDVFLNQAPYGEDGLECCLALVTDNKERKRREEAQKKLNWRNNLILNAVFEGIFWLDVDGTITFANPAALKMLQFRPEEVIGRPFHDVVSHAKVDDILNPRESCPICATLTDGVVHLAEDELYRRKDGAGFRVESMITPVVEQGKIVGLVAVFRDITRRKRIEEALARYAAELERSNDELQQFAYVASHDLQEPLRMVASFVQLLASRYKGKLDSDADEFIDYAVEGATRMQILIQDLLAYARIQTRNREYKQTDCNEVLRKSIGNLQKAVNDTGAVITCDDLPTLMVDETLILQLFQNLLDNALKFRGSRIPRVHISAQKQENEWLFSVRDNGIGIEPQYVDRIFGIFQRLHSRSEYPGSGIGLAICKKIIERHGGRIWVDSVPGEGSVFYFTIPIGAKE